MGEHTVWVDCPGCNQRNDSDLEFCWDCGAPLPKASPVVAASPAESTVAGDARADPVPPLDAPAYSLYDQDAVAVATLFGGTLAGAILMALNYRRLGNKSAAVAAIALGIAVTGLLLVIGFNLPSRALTAVPAVLLVIAVRRIAKALQGIAVAHHVSCGGRLASRWPAFGVGVTVLALLALGVYAFVYVRGAAGPNVDRLGENRTAATPPGPSRVNAKDGLRYVWIEPGTFTMGCSPGDDDCLAREKPAHPVTITKGFWIGQTEVTQAAYARVMDSHPSLLSGEMRPVDNIDWSHAKAYCQAVGMRLPTEAEWEYAARGGNPAALYGPLDSISWHAGNSGRETHTVAQKQPNGYGLYDMLGNVWEWVADWYDDDYYKSAGPPRDPQGPESGEERGIRGGAAYYPPWGSRASYRLGQKPDVANEAAGVRCAGE